MKYSVEFMSQYSRYLRPLELFQRMNFTMKYSVGLIYIWVNVIGIWDLESYFKGGILQWNTGLYLKYSVGFVWVLVIVIFDLENYFKKSLLDLFESYIISIWDLRCFKGFCFETNYIFFLSWGYHRSISNKIWTIAS